jgi:hypothetical protein
MPKLSRKKGEQGELEMVRKFQTVQEDPLWRRRALEVKKKLGFIPSPWTCEKRNRKFRLRRVGRKGAVVRVVINDEL